MEYIIDTDMGFDDLLAIYILIKKGIKIKGITTTFGNSSVGQVTENVLSFLEMLGIDIPVYKGAKGPLYGDYIFDPSFAGRNGLFGVALPKAKRKAMKEGAVEFIISNSNANTSLISLGPATNIAKALLKKSNLKLGKVITSSGYFGINDVKEKRMSWNMRMDKDGTKILYRSGLEVKAIGLDASGNFTDEDFRKFRETYNNNSPLGRMMRVAENFIANRKYRYFTLVSDALALMPVIEKSSVEFIQGQVFFREKEDENFAYFKEEKDGKILVAKYADLEFFIEVLINLLKK